jgi:hypothetical protein
LVTPNVVKQTGRCVTEIGTSAMCRKVERSRKLAVWAFTRYTYSIALKDQGQCETARYWLRFILHISKIQVTAVPTHLISDVPVSRGYLGFKEKTEIFCEDGKNL